VSDAGLISDVHGDFAALQDALAQLAGLGVDDVVCAGGSPGLGTFARALPELLTPEEFPVSVGTTITSTLAAASSIRWCIWGARLSSSSTRCR
jgi:hypothetical protein